MREQTGSARSLLKMYVLYFVELVGNLLCDVMILIANDDMLKLVVFVKMH